MENGFGCCLTIGSFVPQAGDRAADDRTVAERVGEGLAVLADIGYDFAEMTVQSLTRLTEDEFEQVRRTIAASALPVPAFNSFIPAELKVTGPAASVLELERHVDSAMRRVRAVGGELIVFGSGGARNLPDGFSRDEGMKQIETFLRICGKHGAAYGVTVAIEPLNAKESNIIRTVREASELAAKLDLPHVKVLADSYHMDLENESFEEIERAIRSGLLAHVHISARNRHYPGTSGDAPDVDFARMFRILRQTGYAGRLSAECFSDRAAADAAASLAYVRDLWAKAKPE